MFSYPRNNKPLMLTFAFVITFCTFLLLSKYEKVEDMRAVLRQLNITNEKGIKDDTELKPNNDAKNVEKGKVDNKPQVENITISEKESENKTMLIVTRCSRRDFCKGFYDEGSKRFEGCEWSNCEMSRDQERTPEASVVLFYPEEYPEWPRVRFANQTYIHVMNERPCADLWWLPKFDEKINLTWNYRYDADIPYHVTVIEKDHPAEGKYVPRIPFANKTKFVVWAATHCNADSRRDEYVAELSKYIDIDIYGKCGTLNCPQELQNECADMWERKYKFYLAFENAICKDYVTEKLYRTLKREMIPVVLGGADYSVVSPPHSYIDVKDFNSPKDLAAYLLHLAQNPDEYYEYFQWKQRYHFRLLVNYYCLLCEIAHNKKKWTKPALRDYHNWYMYVCNNDLIGEMRKKGNW